MKAIRHKLEHSHTYHSGDPLRQNLWVNDRHNTRALTACPEASGLASFSLHPTPQKGSLLKFPLLSRIPKKLQKNSLQKLDESIFQELKKKKRIVRTVQQINLTIKSKGDISKYVEILLRNPMTNILSGMNSGLGYIALTDARILSIPFSFCEL